MFDEIFGAIFEGLAALFSALFEWLSTAFEWLAEGFSALVHGIADLFMGDTSDVGIGALLAVFILLLLELVGWLILLLFELVMLLVQRRKPRKVKKPVIWRPKRSTES